MKALTARDPKRIGPYVLFGRLGDSGTDSVYAGRSSTGQRVAVEVVCADLVGDPGFRERFRTTITDARTVASVYLAPVLDADPNGSAPWVATSLPPGLTLAQVVAAHGVVPEPTLRRLAQGVAGALAALHFAGLPHGALSPDTVLLTLEGPRVIAWVSPRPGTSTDDVALLGSTLVSAASGRKPTGPGSADDVLLAMPPWLREVVGRCLATDPRTRPLAGELVDQLVPTGSPSLAGDWLPPALASDLVAKTVRRGAAAAAMPPPSSPPVTPASTTGTEAAISRRSILVGIAGSAVALGGIATVAVVRSREPSSSRLLSVSSPRSSQSALPSESPQASVSPSASPRGSVPPSPWEPFRVPLSGEVVAPTWTVTVDDVPTGMIASDKTVALISEKSTTFLDFAGRPVFRPLRVTELDISSMRRGAAFADGVFYIVGLSPQISRLLVAVDATTGKQRWVVSLEDSKRPSPYYVAVGGGTVYVCGDYYIPGELFSKTCYIWAFDAATGSEQWRIKGADLTNVLVPSSGRYLLAGWVPMGARSSEIQMIDAAGKGARRWRKTVPTASYHSMGLPLTSYADGLFIYGRDKIHAVDQVTGQEKWHLPAESARSGVRFGTPLPSVDGKTVYIPAGRDLVALHAVDGSMKWVATLPRSVFFSPSLYLGYDGPSAWRSTDTVFVTDTTNTLWAIDAATGKARWKYTDPEWPDAGFNWCVGDDRVWISSELTVTAIDARR